MAIIYSDLHQRVTKNGVLEKAIGIVDKYVAEVNEVFGPLGKNTLGYMNGELSQDEWEKVYTPAFNIVDSDFTFPSDIKFLSDKASRICDNPEGFRSVDREKEQIVSGLGKASSRVIESYSMSMKGFLSALRNYLKDVGEGRERISTPLMFLYAPRMNDREGNTIEFTEIIMNAKGVTFGLGYRDGILTPHELALAGRYGKEHNILDPHIPLGIQRSEIKADLASEKRQGEMIFTVYTDLFTGSKEPLTLTLESLDNDNRTVQGPRVIDKETAKPSEELTEFYVSEFSERSEKVPFARESDWFFKG